MIRPPLPASRGSRCPWPVAVSLLRSLPPSSLGLALGSLCGLLPSKGTLPMELGATLTQNDLISGSFITSSKTPFPDKIMFPHSRGY